MSKRRKKLCNCQADETWLGATETMLRGRARKDPSGRWNVQWRIVRSTRIHHRLGEKHFWHWKDVPKALLKETP